MATVTISLRLPEDEVKQFEDLAHELGTGKPAFLKQALRRGAEDLRFERACIAYRSGEATLSRAAELAGVSLREMILKLKNAGLQLTYGLDDFMKDLQP